MGYFSFVVLLVDGLRRGLSSIELCFSSALSTVLHEASNAVNLGIHRSQYYLNTAIVRGILVMCSGNIKAVKDTVNIFSDVASP